MSKGMLLLWFMVNSAFAAMNLAFAVAGGSPLSWGASLFCGLVAVYFLVSAARA